MALSTTWIVVIIVVVLAIIISNIMLLIQNNKPFVFPDSYEKTQAQKNAEKKEKKADDNEAN